MNVSERNKTVLGSDSVPDYYPSQFHQEKMDEAETQTLSGATAVTTAPIAIRERLSRFGKLS